MLTIVEVIDVTDAISPATRKMQGPFLLVRQTRRYRSVEQNVFI